MTWQHSSDVDQVIVAFVAALSELTNVHKTNTADLGSHRYSYADLGTVLEVVKPVLTSHQLAVSQPVGAEGVTTLVFHGPSGQWLGFGPLQIAPTQRSPQAEGSAITYARRYQLLAALNLATEDDDGARASQHVNAHPNAARVDALRADWQTMTPEQQAAGKTWAAEQGKEILPKALLADASWLEQVESWVDEQLNQT